MFYQFNAFNFQQIHGTLFTQITLCCITLWLVFNFFFFKIILFFKIEFYYLLLHNT